MYHKELITHINGKKASGVSDYDIHKELEDDGWSTEDIKQAFYYVENPEKLKHFSITRMLKSEIKESTFLVTLLILIAIFSGLFLYFKDDTITYEIVAPASLSPKVVTFSFGVQPSMANPDFFAKVKDQFINNKATFIEVDLSKMIVRVYKDGTTTLELPVKTKGKEGSWWETPAGLYKIETKEKSHYSSMGHVSQPWSMEFQGNFFIHGWPKYDDGSPVATTFSGGCIRLADEDAKKIFDEVIVGTPILVYEKDFIPDTFSYAENKPTILASSFMTADLLNNYIFLKNNETIKIRPSGMTKLMTALVATEYINIEKTTTIKDESLVGTPVPRLTAGMKIDVYQLLFPLLREDSNEAAETIAHLYGKGQFVRHMNEKAKAIGMSNTHFADPTGNSSDNISTTEDMFMLAKYIYNNRSFLFNITSGKVKTNTYGKSIFTDLGNGNEFYGTESFVGGVSGTTDTVTGYNFSVFELPINNSVRPIFFLSFDSKDTKGDVVGAMRYVRGKYK